MKISKKNLKWSILVLTAASMSVSASAVEIAGSFPTDTKYKMMAGHDQPIAEIKKTTDYFESEGFISMDVSGNGKNYVTAMDGVFTDYAHEQIAFVKFNLATENSAHENKLFIEPSDDGFTFHGITGSGTPYIVYFVSGNLESTRNSVKNLEAKLGSSTTISSRLQEVKDLFAWNREAYAIDCPPPSNGSPLNQAAAFENIDKAMKRDNPSSDGEIVKHCAANIGESLGESIAWGAAFVGATKIAAKTKVGAKVLQKASQVIPFANVPGWKGIVGGVAFWTALTSSAQAIAGDVTSFIGYTHGGGLKQTERPDFSSPVKVKTGAKQAYSFTTFTANRIQTWMNDNFASVRKASTKDKQLFFCSTVAWVAGNAANVMGPKYFEVMMAKGMAKSFLALRASGLVTVEAADIAQAERKASEALTKLRVGDAEQKIAYQEKKALRGDLEKQSLEVRAGVAERELQTAKDLEQHAAKIGNTEGVNAAKTRVMAAQARVDEISGGNSKGSSYADTREYKDAAAKLEQNDRRVVQLFTERNSVFAKNKLGVTKKVQDPNDRLLKARIEDELFLTQKNGAQMRMNLEENELEFLASKNGIGSKEYKKALASYANDAKLRLGYEGFDKVRYAKDLDAKADSFEGVAGKEKEMAELRRKANEARLQATGFLERSTSLKGSSKQEIQKEVARIKAVPENGQAKDSVFKLEPKTEKAMTDITIGLVGAERTEVVSLGHRLMEKNVADAMVEELVANPKGSFDILYARAQAAGNANTLRQLVEAQLACNK